MSLEETHQEPLTHPDASKTQRGHGRGATATAKKRQTKKRDWRYHSDFSQHKSAQIPKSLAATGIHYHLRFLCRRVNFVSLVYQLAGFFVTRLDALIEASLRSINSASRGSLISVDMSSTDHIHSP